MKNLLPRTRHSRAAYVGRDLDNIIQAIEDPQRAFLLGVQWHPEFLLYLRSQRRLFRGLVEAARARLQSR